MHRHMAGDVVEDIGLGKIIELVGPPDRDGGWKAPVAKAIEEEKGGHVAAYGFGLKSGQRLEEAIDFLQPGYAIWVRRGA